MHKSSKKKEEPTTGISKIYELNDKLLRGEISIDTYDRLKAKIEL